MEALGIYPPGSAWSGMRAEPETGPRSLHGLRGRQRVGAAGCEGAREPWPSDQRSGISSPGCSGGAPEPAGSDSESGSDPGTA